MNKILLLLFFCLFSKVESNSQNKNLKFKRYVSMFIETDSKQEIFTGEIIKKSKTLSFFEYKTKKDSLRSLKLEFNEKTNQLFFNRTEFYKLSKQNFKYENINFEYFKHKKSKKGLILFNKKYGILAISNLYGPSLIFLKNKKRNLNTEKLILKILNE